MIKGFKICNIVFSGRMPFKRKLINPEISRLIEESKLNWQLINEEVSPIIRRFVEKKKTITNSGKRGNAHISIWASGAIIVTGVTSRKEAEEHYKATIKDIKRFSSVLSSSNIENKSEEKDGR